MIVKERERSLKLEGSESERLSGRERTIVRGGMRKGSLYSRVRSFHSGSIRD